MLCVYGFLERPGQRCGINRKDMGEVFGPMGVVYTWWSMRLGISFFILLFY